MCNPLTTAETIGREYLEATLQPPSGKIDNLFYRIKSINQRSYSVDESLQEIKDIHGSWSGVDEELVSFAKNLFGDDPNFRQSLLELENVIIQAQNISEDFNTLVSVANNLTLEDVSNTLSRAYLDNVDILLPKGLRKEIQNNLDEFPFFSEMSEALGGLYANFVISDKATNIVDGIIGDVLNETGLSSILKKDSWIGMLPEYAMNFHDNVRLFQRLGTRVMPSCTYGKIYNIMDEPLAHVYSFAQDAYFFIGLLENRTAVLAEIIGKYRGMIKKLNSFFPICTEISVDNTPRDHGYGTPTDLNGNVVREREVSREQVEIL